MTKWFGFTRNFTQHYQIDKKLGEGAYGCTHLCIEKSSGQQYAVKLLRKADIRDDADMDAIRKEVKILQTVSAQNDHIVTLFGVFEDETNVYLLLEICTGGELFDWIRSKEIISEADAAAILRQVLRVTAECHLNGIAHRDLKPENFLFTAPGSSTIKAIDFGLSDFFTPTTKFNTIVGSPYYVAPEVLKKRYGPAADVWSAGVIGYVLLCGGPPFWGETDADLFKSIIEDDLDLETDPWPNVSESAKDLLRRLLTKNSRVRLSASQALSHPWVREGGSASDVPLCYNIITSLNRFAKTSLLKRLFFSHFAQQWHDKSQIQSLIDQFQTIDTDGSGNVTYEEFKTAVEGMKTGEGQTSVFDQFNIDQMLTTLDTDKSGTIDYAEFIAAALQTINMEKDENWDRGARKAFEALDIDGDGYLSLDELQGMLNAERSEVSSMLVEVDKDGDGQIDFQEFSAVLFAGLSPRGSMALPANYTVPCVGSQKDPASQPSGTVKPVDPVKVATELEGLLNAPVLKAKHQAPPASSTGSQPPGQMQQPMNPAAMMQQMMIQQQQQQQQYPGMQQGNQQQQMQSMMAQMGFHMQPNGMMAMMGQQPGGPMRPNGMMPMMGMNQANMAPDPGQNLNKQLGPPQQQQKQQSGSAASWAGIQLIESLQGEVQVLKKQLQEKLKAKEAAKQKAKEEAAKQKAKEEAAKQKAKEEAAKQLSDKEASFSLATPKTLELSSSEKTPKGSWSYDAWMYQKTLDAEADSPRRPRTPVYSHRLLDLSADDDV